MQISFVQCSTCFGLCHRLATSPSLHPLISPRSRHNRCRVKKRRGKKKQLNEKISKSYVYRKAPRDSHSERLALLFAKPSKQTAWATCVLLILSMRVHRLPLLLLLQRRRRSHIRTHMIHLRSAPLPTLDNTQGRGTYSQKVEI